MEQEDHFYNKSEYIETVYFVYICLDKVSPLHLLLFYSTQHFERYYKII